MTLEEACQDKCFRDVLALYKTTRVMPSIRLNHLQVVQERFLGHMIMTQIS
mgnify:CR=1 FL=1